MLQNKNKQRSQAVTWKHFDHKGYSLFRSLGREVRIGTLAVSTLAFTHAGAVVVQQKSDEVRVTPEQGVNLSEVEVTGSLAPLSANQAARIVSTISREQIAQSSAQSVNDLLKTALGVDVRQRGGFGVQTDISIDGGTFDQVTILLNGVNINSPQSGHLAADFPVALSDIERIEVLEGAASRSLAGNSFSGVINIVTRADERNNVQIAAAGGSYGSADAGLSGTYHYRNTSHQLSLGYKRSDGGTENSDFDKKRLFYQGALTSSQVDVSWQAGYCAQDYGANTFYSGAYPNQYEENDRYFASVKAQTKGWFRFEPTIYWNRSYDHFQLIRNSSTGENFNRTDVYGSRLNGSFNWLAGRTSLGMEVRNEGILSRNLGRDLDESQYVNIPGEDLQYTRSDNRTNVSYHLEHNILLDRFTLSMGVVANMNTALDSKFRWYPGVDLSYRPGHSWRLYASWNKAFRMPTYTDLYYKTATHEANAGLKPEVTQSFMLGSRYFTNGFSATVQAFYHRGSDMIDWVMYTADDVYHSTNFRLNNYGIEGKAEVDFRALLGEKSLLHNFTVGYTYMYQDRKDDVEIFKSNYALEYLRHKFTASLTHGIFSRLSASWDFRWQNRMGNYIVYADHKSTGTLKSYKPYGVLDLKILWTAPTYTLYVTGNNILNCHYYDYGNVPQPGIWIMAGGTYRINL